MARYFHDWMLDDFFRSIQDLQDNEDRLKKTLRILLLQEPDLSLLSNSPAEYMKSILQNPYIHYSLGINRSNGILWFNQESVEEWLEYSAFPGYILDQMSQSDWDENRKLEGTIRAYQILTRDRQQNS